MRGRLGARSRRKRLRRGWSQLVKAAMTVEESARCSDLGGGLEADGAAVRQFSVVKDCAGGEAGGFRGLSGLMPDRQGRHDSRARPMVQSQDERSRVAGVETAQ